MSIDAVKVPADIQVEEKIIGPIGLRQIFILIGTGGVSYVFWSIAKQAGANATFQLLAWLPLVIGGAFSFVKIHDVSLLRLLLLTIEKMQKPSHRTFGPRTGITITIRTNGPEKKKKKGTKDPKAHEAIEELSTILDTKMHEAAQEEQAMPNTKNIVIQEEQEVEYGEIPMNENRPNIDGITPPSTV